MLFDVKLYKNQIGEDCVVISVENLVVVLHYAMRFNMITKEAFEWFMNHLKEDVANEIKVERNKV